MQGETMIVTKTIYQPGQLPASLQAIGKQIKLTLHPHPVLILKRAVFQRGLFEMTPGAQGWGKRYIFLYLSLHFDVFHIPIILSLGIQALFIFCCSVFMYLALGGLWILGDAQFYHNVYFQNLFFVSDSSVG